MSSPRVHDVQRIAAVFAIALLVALTFPFSARAAEEVRTDPGKLPGYTITSTASPMSMLMYEEVIPVPVEPGEPHGEGSLSYTSTKLETGPQARAVASSFWPGAAMGDGFSTICSQGQEGFEDRSGLDAPDNCDNAHYEVKSEATYPSKNPETAKEIEPLGAGMRTSALGLDVVSSATSAMSPNEEAVGFGNVRSRSGSTVVKNRAVATTVSSAEDVSIGGGVITIESVKTVLEATSDAKKGTTDGTTEVQGLVIGGQGYTVDENGIQPVQDDEPQEGGAQLPPMPGAKEMREQLGIEVELAKHEKSVDGADASRKAGGLRISINTDVLKQKLTENVPVYDIFDSVPPEISTQFAALLALSPQVDFVFGRGQVRAAGVEGLDLDFDLGGFAAPPPPPAPPAAADTDPVAPAPPPDAGTAGAVAAPEIPGEAAAPPPAPEAPAPVAAAAPVTPAAAQVPLFGGISPALTAAGLVLAALGGRGLAAFSAAAMGGMTGAFCDRGVPRRIPHLRA